MPGVPQTIDRLPQSLRDLLAAPPRAGKGVHAWLFKVASQLHAHLPAVEIVNLLESRVQGCGRHVSRKEIEDAVKNSIPRAWQPEGSTAPIQSHPKWPGLNKEQREAIVRDNGGLADLWERSCPRLEDNAAHTEEIIDRLFPGNPLLCCGKSQLDFDTKPREDWRGELAQIQMIVPSPMSAITGLTKDGKESKHTLANTGERRFLICEFDTGTADEQAAMLLHLRAFAPLVCVAHSGGKSLHGWFYVHSQPEEKILRFFRYAVSLGADRATWTRSQFVRMPDGTRDNGKRQTVFFLDFKPIGNNQMNNLLETPELREVPDIETESKPAKPLIEFFKPSELSAFTPPEGFNLAGNYHIQKAAPFVIGGAPGVGKSRAAVALAVTGAAE